MLFILLTQAWKYNFTSKITEDPKKNFSFSRLSKISTSSYMMMLGDGYLDDDFLYLGGSGDTQLRHVAVLGVEDGEEAGAKGEV